MSSNRPYGAPGTPGKPASSTFAKTLNSSSLGNSGLANSTSLNSVTSHPASTHNAANTVAPAKIALSVFNSFHIEMIRYITNQYDIATFLDAGMSQEAAEELMNGQISSKLISIGEPVGLHLVSRLAQSHDISLHKQDLDMAVQFLSQELWRTMFKKTADYCGLDPTKTYQMIQDLSFDWIKHFSLPNDVYMLQYCRPFTWLVCGVLRGALAGLGFDVKVNSTFETSQTSQFVVIFEIRQELVPTFLQ